MIESTDRDLARRTRMKRIPGVDLFKIIGVIAVITLHVTSLSFPATRHITEFSNPLLIANQAARFAVPYFFIISGYFWGKKIIAGADILQTSIKFVKRVLIVFLAWSFIYILTYDIFGDFKY
jgi:surface polysaccharide O-acyltransferase-like enzyme